MCMWREKGVKERKKNEEREKEERGEMMRRKEKNSLPRKTFLFFCCNALCLLFSHIPLFCFSFLFFSTFYLTAEEQKNKVSGEGETELVVTSEKFGNMLKWFGPLMIPNVNAATPGHSMVSSLMDETENNVLHKLRALLIEP